MLHTISDLYPASNDLALIKGIVAKQLLLPLNHLRIHLAPKTVALSYPLR